MESIVVIIESLQYRTRKWIVGAASHVAEKIWNWLMQSMRLVCWRVMHPTIRRISGGDGMSCLTCPGWWRLVSATIAATFYFEGLTIFHYFCMYILWNNTSCWRRCDSAMLLWCNRYNGNRNRNVGRMTSPSTSGNQNSKWLVNFTSTVRTVIGKCWNDCGNFVFYGLTFFNLFSVHSYHLFQTRRSRMDSYAGLVGSGWNCGRVSFFWRTAICVLYSH